MFIKLFSCKKKRKFFTFSFPANNSPNNLVTLEDTGKKRICYFYTRLDLMPTHKISLDVLQRKGKMYLIYRRNRVVNFG